MSDTKKVVLPGGQEVEIKKPGILAMRSVAGQLPMLPRNQSSGVDLSWPDQVDMAVRLVCACSVKPKFAEKPGGGEVSVDDLSLEDFNALASAVMEYAGFTKSAEELGPLSGAKET